VGKHYCILVCFCYFYVFQLLTFVFICENVVPFHRHDTSESARRVEVILVFVALSGAIGSLHQFMGVGAFVKHRTLTTGRLKRKYLQMKNRLKIPWV
jgi:hypothetical protein